MDRPGFWVVLPVKDLPDAKQRLAGVLTAQERRELSFAMVQDVLRALDETAGLAGILLVTRDPDARRLARRYGARVLMEEQSRGHTAASNFGARTLAQEGAAGMVQLPGDIPLVTPEEIAALLHVHDAAPAVTLAPSHDDRGTNAVACSPPDVLPLRFGDDSFPAHLRHARTVGIEPRIVRRPGLALDIDTPDDLATFLAAPSETFAYAYLIDSGIAKRITPFANAQAAPP